MEQAAIANANARTASRSTLAQLVLFSLSLGILPISSYFFSLKYVWNGNSTWAAITAVAAANVVLVAYIFASLRDDVKPIDSKTPIKDPETRKER
ncbi:uncharacterized protein BT62DRAFT_1002840 [Guyanagaster necrorhizus]|uniref:Vacuolar ATPase assembly integral membrane protein VMA21 n=1 Tax=Guyanagaster necrorhizus TaxID=856835 RepID=A0A9P8AV81_9AGAR|nr:uncharacterized protein BT62DRAFT_1002840 [Guyanagaster necrorhizus MCA 3950]KAG7449253.1 hypothetical protein BT62DRAFT_1002840 [Guyanagaster necrorhizus MCA 3950]